MPLWLGAKEQPRYRPKGPAGRAMNTTALTGESTRRHDGQVAADVRASSSGSRPSRAGRPAVTSARTLDTCRLTASSSSSGKKRYAW